MERQRSIFHNCRAYFPHVTQQHVGQKVLPTAPYYASRGFRLIVAVEEPLAANDIPRINDLGRWVNQNYIVRLCALIEARGLFSSIDKSVDGWEDMDLLRRLRNRFAHSSGRFDPQDPDQVRLRDRIVRHCKLPTKDYEDYPLSVDTVLDPIFDGCARYVRRKLGMPSAYFGEKGHLFRFQSGHPSERSDAGWFRMG